MNLSQKMGRDQPFALDRSDTLGVLTSAELVRTWDHFDLHRGCCCRFSLGVKASFHSGPGRESEG